MHLLSVFPDILSLASNVLAPEQLPKRKGRSVWVIEWEWWGEHHKVHPNIFHTLPARVGLESIIRHLWQLYINSGEFCVSDRPLTLSYYAAREKWLTREGERLWFGGNPCLIANKVRNFTVSVDHASKCEVVRFIQLPAYRWSRATGQIEDLGKILHREVRIRVPC